MRLYFVRHGQTYLNKYNKMQGWSDSPLTPEGEAVAKTTGERLKDIPFTAVYTSDLGRTIQTAKLIIADNPNVDDQSIVPMPELRETFFGSFEADYGRNVYPQIAERKGVAVDQLFATATMEEIAETMKELDPYGDAESASEFKKRLLAGLDLITGKQYQTEAPEILVVTHGNTIRHIVKDIDATVNVSVEIDNSSVTVVDYERGRYELKGFNT